MYTRSWSTAPTRVEGSACCSIGPKAGSSKSGRHRARLDCVRTNTLLRAYYENAGYHLVGYRCFEHEVGDARGGLVPADSALYEKLLTAHDATGP
jgi:hypothetical protein